MRTHPRIWVVGLAAALGAVTMLGACSSMLDVTNPGAITQDNLNDPVMIPAIVNGVIGEFQPAFDNAALDGGLFTDELISLFTTVSTVDLRNIDPSSSGAYVSLQRTRGAADGGIAQVKAMLGDKANSNLDIARMYAYGGYSIVLLAEMYCSAPIDLSAAYSPAELFTRAIDRFNNAVTVAAAAKAAGANAAAADSLTNLANLGIARASLDVNDKTTAIAKAQLVPANFGFWVNHSANSAKEYNSLGDANRRGHEYIGLDPNSFVNLHDPRIPQDTARVQVAFNTSFYIWLPYQPPEYSAYKAGTLVRIENYTSIRFASGLEAQYIIAEAQGPTLATLAFVNQRRAVGTQPPVNDSGDQLMADLRDQRRRDLFLAGHRMGDLQRYLKYYNVDNFPKGVWPGDNVLVYGTQTCMPLPNVERNSNPNIK